MAQLVVVQSGYQVEPQRETTAAIAVALRHDPKYLQMPDDVLHHDPQPRQLPILSLLLACQLRALRLLLRRARVLVLFLQALIAGIAQQMNACSNLAARLFEDGKVMRLARSVSGTNDFARPAVDDHLRLDGVPLTLARIVPPLFFFGRSIGVSVASTTTTSIRLSLPRNCFLPGSRKSARRLRMSSTFVMMRHAVGSLNPYLCAMWNCVGYSRQYSRVSSTWSGGER
jgi:hypothetical protein